MSMRYAISLAQVVSADSTKTPLASAVNRTVYVLLDLKDEWDDRGVYVGLFSTLELAQNAVRIAEHRRTGPWEFKENVGALGAYDANYDDGEFRRVWRVLLQHMDMLISG